MTKTLEIAPFAASSLKDRMIERILEREDEGHTRWTPSGIYAQLVKQHPELYPPSPPRGILGQFGTQEFVEELAKAREHRFIARVPAHMMANAIGRRIIDMAGPLLFNKLLDATEDPDHSAIDFRELRMLMKDALMYVQESEELFSGKKAEGEGVHDTQLSMEDVLQVLGKSSPERREVMAKGIAAALLQAAQAPGIIDGEAEEE